MCAQLYLALRNTGDLSEITVRRCCRGFDSGEVEGVEIGTETNRVLFHDVKVFERSGVDLTIPGCAFRVDGRCRR